MNTKQLTNEVQVFNYDAEYAAQVMDTIPVGYVDKTSTGIGLTTLALENEENTILLVPNIPLVDNKSSQYPNERCDYRVLPVWGETKRSNVDVYIESIEESKQPIKIICTYDSLYKVEHLIPQSKLIIDESDNILDLTKGNRRDATLHMLDVAKKNREKTSFISATPIPLVYMPKWISELPQIVMNWSNTIVAKPILAERTYPYKSLREEFIAPLKREGSMTVAGKTYKKVIVFLNSVTTISKIIKECGLHKDECGVIASKAIRNDAILKGVHRYRGVGETPKYLFVTSTGFQGIDIHDEEAMTIAVSNTNKEYTMLDLKTDLKQAISRNRTKENPNYGTYVFIYNQSLFNKSEEELLKKMDYTYSKIENALGYVNHCISNDIGYMMDSDFEEYTYVNKDTGFRVINDNAFNADKYFILETRNQYTKGFNIAGVTGQVATVEPVELPRDVTYADVAIHFRDNHVNGKVDWGVLSTRTDWITVVESLWRLTKTVTTNYTMAKENLNAYGDSYKTLILELRREFKTGVRYTNKEINEKLQKVYDENDLGRRAKTKDLYEIFGKKAKPYRHYDERGFEIIK